MAFPKRYVLVAAELGCPWPAWLCEILNGSERRVLAQTEKESPAAFAERLLGIMKSELVSKLGTVVVLCNERTDAAQQTARRVLLDALMRGGSRRRSQRFIVAARGESGKVKRALGTLGSGNSRSPRKLELRFEAAPVAPATEAAIARVA